MRGDIDTDREPHVAQAPAQILLFGFRVLVDDREQDRDAEEKSRGKKTPTELEVLKPKQIRHHESDQIRFDGE